jgi:hypothetical protein
MLNPSAEETHVHTDIRHMTFFTVPLYNLTYRHSPSVAPPLLLSAALRTRLVDGASIAVGTTSTQRTPKKQWKQ